MDVDEEEVVEEGPEDVDSRTVVIQRLRDAGFNWTDIAKIVRVDRKTIYTWRKEGGFDELPQNAVVGKVLNQFLFAYDVSHCFSYFFYTSQVMFPCGTP